MKVVTFGELMLRLSPPNNQRILQSKSYCSSYAGSEANVAVSLSMFGIASKFITALPDNIIGKTAMSQLMSHGVDTSDILHLDGRIGIYFVESGYSQRPSSVIYDRNNSVISNTKISDFNWNSLLESYDWFHFSGITPALSKELAFICEQALMEAKKLGLTVSCDLNYRNKLWSKEEASRVMKRYMKYIDVLIGNEEDAKIIFGFDYTTQDSQNINLNDYESIMREIHKVYGIKKIYFTLRESINATRNKWSSIGFDGELFFVSRKYDIDILDRLGAGDSFSAGIIYSEINKLPTQEIVDFATAASCLKHTIHEDFNIVTLDEVKSLMNGKETGRIKR